MKSLTVVTMFDLTADPIACKKLRSLDVYKRQLVDYMDEKMGRFREENREVFISHGDALQEAEALAEEIRERFGIGKFVINRVGPTIGAHSGPGTMAVFFFGEER